MKCQKCQTPNRKGSRFCKQCGRSFLPTPHPIRRAGALAGLAALGVLVSILFHHPGGLLLVLLALMHASPARLLKSRYKPLARPWGRAWLHGVIFFALIAFLFERPLEAEAALLALLLSLLYFTLRR